MQQLVITIRFSGWAVGYVKRSVLPSRLRRRRRGEHDARAADEDELARLRRRRHRGQARGPREPGPAFVDAQGRHRGLLDDRYGGTVARQGFDGRLFDDCALRRGTRRLRFGGHALTLHLASP